MKRCKNAIRHCERPRNFGGAKQSPHNDGTLGRIHSFESFGSHEGPGVRYVIFMQGCLARCLYCQNPDTWLLDQGMPVTAKEAFQKIEKVLPYINASRGGVTVSGGEPLLQPDFVAALFRLCRKRKIHTAVDTSCFFKKADTDKIKRLIKLTDLFIVDIKAPEEKLHKKMTARNLTETLSFISLLEKNKKPYWIRYVLVPGLNDRKMDLARLKGIMSKFKRCQKFEIIPYHTFGRHKWKYLGMRYFLKDTPPATIKDIKEAQKVLVGLRIGE